MMFGSSFLMASVMMAVTGMLAMLVFRHVSAQSWRLRSWLIAGVLLQGLMIARSPIHLGWIDASASSPVEAQSVLSGAEMKGLTFDEPSQTSQRASVFGGAAHEKSTAWRLRSIASSLGWKRVLAWVWMTVAVAMMIIAMTRYVRLLRIVRHLEPAPDQWQRKWKSLLKQSRQVRDANCCEMLVSQQVGPLMVRRPTGYSLIVPESFWNRLSDRQRRGVMLHELAHLERNDVWRALIARLITTLHWFNPLAWWALQQHELASECACDHRVAREGQQAATGFASALVDLVQWQDECESKAPLQRGIGFQAMAAPPLTVRVSQLLKPTSQGDSPMKRIIVSLIAVSLILLSCVQIRLTTAQEDRSTGGPGVEAALKVFDETTQLSIEEVVGDLDVTDPTTKRLATLLEDPEGKVAIAGMLNSLRAQYREQIRAEAIPRFIGLHFQQDADGQWTPRDGSKETIDRWLGQSKRLAENIRNVNKTAADIAAKIDTSSEAGGLFKRLLQDPQSSVAVLMTEMNGGDIISQYLTKALSRLLVERGDGTLTIVESQRSEIEEKIEQFERADDIRKRLQRALPDLAMEFSSFDEQHQKLKRYLNDPNTAVIVALKLSENVSTATEAVDRLHEQFDKVSVDKPDGLQIEDARAWDMMNEIYQQVDRVKAILPRVKETMSQQSETLFKDDPLTARLATQMSREPLAAMLAAELPYADTDAGEELRNLLSEVMTESNGKLQVNEGQADKVSEKAKELLRVCRQIRRATAEIDQVLAKMDDRDFVKQFGEAGRYVLLDEVRRFAERQQPDPIVLMRKELLIANDDGRTRVRDDRREVIRKLVEQAEQIRAEAGNDDF